MPNQGLKVFPLCLSVMSNPARKNFPVKVFAQPQECGARLLTVTNQPVSRRSTNFFPHFLRQNIFSFQLVENMTTDLVENFKSKRLRCKTLISNGGLDVVRICE